MHRWLLIGLMLVVCGFAAGCSDRDVTSSTRPISNTTATKGWTSVTSLSGDTDTVGEPFALTGGRVRVSYTLTNPAYDQIIFAVYVVEEGTYLDTQGGFSAVDVSELGSGSVITIKAPGSYYLHIISVYCDWEVTIEEEL